MPSLGYCIIVTIGIRRLHSVFRFSVSKFLIPVALHKINVFFSGMEEASSILFAEYAGNNGHQDLHKK